MELTTPLAPADLRAALPREVTGMEDAEIQPQLEILEHALRAQFGVVGVDADTDEVLARAMVAAWPSFRAQLRQVSQEESSASGSQVSYARAGVLDFVWPAFVGSILAGVSRAASSAAAPAVTELVR